MPVRSVLVVKRCFSRRRHPATGRAVRHPVPGAPSTMVSCRTGPVRSVRRRRRGPATDGIALLPAWMADRVIQVQGASLITQDQQQVATILQLV